MGFDSLRRLQRGTQKQTEGESTVMLCKKVQKNAGSLMLLLTVAYFVSYVTRLNYNAILVEIIDAVGLSKAAASLPLTGLAVFYGVGQLISGYAGDRVQPKWIVSVGLLATVCMNLLLPFCTTSAQMTAVWCVNGLAQAFMWPPIVKLMSELLDEDNYNKACIVVTSGGSAGQILVYLLSPVLIGFGGWKTVFYISAAMGAAMLVVWLLKCPHIGMQRQSNSSASPVKAKFPWSVMLIAILAAIVLQGTLRDGITAWMPTLISETFQLGSEISILSGGVLPVFAIVSIAVVSEIRQRYVRNELKLAAILFFAAAILAVLLALFRQVSPILAVITLALLVACMHGTNLLLISLVPRYYARFGVVSLVSGVLNSCTYLGAALSTYGIAVVSEGYGWTATIVLWGVIALGGGLLCSGQIRRWKKFSE